MIFVRNKGKIVDYLCQNAVKFNFSDTISVGDHSKLFISEVECSCERKRGREEEFPGCCVFLALISDPNNGKMLIFGGSNTLKFDFSDKMTIGDHSKQFKSQEDCSGKRERKPDRELAGCFVFHALVSDRNDCKSLIFCVKMP